MRILCLLPLLVLLGAQPASAAVVTGTPDTSAERGERERNGSVTVVDDHDALNVLDVRLVGERAIVREDGADPLEVRGTCTLESPRVAVCEIGHLEVLAGSGDDEVTVRQEEALGWSTFVDGGRGQDVVRAIEDGLLIDGGPGDDVLRGGAGFDEIMGGAGDDRILGGGDTDRLAGDGRESFGEGPPVAMGSDTIDGGPGRDFATWEERREAVLIDLAERGPVGADRERDRVSGVEEVAGGRGNDALLGDGERNELLGGEGIDTLVGRGGNDILDAGTAKLPSDFGFLDGAPDRLLCGRGRDLVVNADSEELPRSCERLSFSRGDALDGNTLVLQPRLARGGLGFHVVATCCAESYRRVIVRAGGRELGRSRLVPIGDVGRFLRVRLRRPLPRRGVVRVIHQGTTRGRPYRFVYRLRR